MVDMRDLKSLDPKGCAGSSPVRGTILKNSLLKCFEYQLFFLYLQKNN